MHMRNNQPAVCSRHARTLPPNRSSEVQRPPPLARTLPASPAARGQPCEDLGHKNHSVDCHRNVDGFELPVVCCAGLRRQRLRRAQLLSALLAIAAAAPPKLPPRRLGGQAPLLLLLLLLVPIITGLLPSRRQRPQPQRLQARAGVPRRRR